ncbi:LacI family DNA-binding transcriptional regulator [Hymenobacter sp. BRD128]|uniref:LacI family DNA-binding transcriptional regulator n=1 Tax=Hymenobacter sp. BRD128 TaxID=2675878 RepID=UPI001C26894E|nr:LacI family DNA-binding transcriptional regulator [Hymenobacter sp. BRD128]
MKKRTLIHDIAKHLEVSIATVSLVLNGKAKEHRISDALAVRVLKYVEEVGYKPNQLAKSLRTGKTHVIGLLVEDIANPFFATVAGLIERHALARGYHILYCSTENDTTKAKDLIAMLQDRHIDGYIIAPPAGVEKEIEALLKNDIPTVLFDRYLPNLPTDYIVVDNEGGAYEAACHLLAQGMARVAFLTTESEQTQMAARLQGYTRAMQVHGQPLIVQRIPLAFEGDKEVSIAAIGRFLEANPTCEAIVFANNSLTVYGLEAIGRLGRRIPQDLAVISFDDNDLFRLHSPPITAVAQPVEALAETLINVLLNGLATAQAAPPDRQQIVLPLSLLVRGSSVR